MTFDPRSVRSIEDKMNVTTQQYLIGQTRYTRDMIDLHERELLLVWVALLIVSVSLSIDNVLLRKEIKRATRSK